MQRASKLLFLAGFIVLGFYAKSAFAFTCQADATGNWNAAGTWVNCNSTTPQAGDAVVATSTVAITLTVNVSTAALASLDLSGLTTGGGTLAGSSSITVRGVTASNNNVIFGGTVTWTGTLSLTPTTATANLDLTTNGKLLTNVTLAGSAATTTLIDNLSFTAAKTDVLTVTSGGSKLNMNGKTISGNSATNRLLITSNTLGTQVQLIRSSGAFASADFRDIDLEASYDASAITGLSGDCGGNSADFTFTAATSTASTGTASFTWSTHAWTVRVPLPQDDVVISNVFISGRTVTMDMPRLGHTIDASGTTWSGTAPTFSSSGGNTIHGSFLLPSGTLDSNNALTFEGRSGTLANGTSSAMPANGWQIQTGGRSASGTTVMNAFGGTYQLLDAFTLTGSFTLSNGDFDANDFNFTSTVFVSVSGTRSVIMGSGTWTVTATGNVWNVGSGLTVTPETSTINLTNLTATSKNFVGSSKTYNNVTWTGQNIVLSGNNTFTTMAFENATTSVATTVGVRFTGTSTTTITSTLTSNGSAGVLAIASSTTASVWEIKKTGGGTVCTDFMKIAQSLATPTLTWYAGTGSTDVGSNSGWSFTACPAGAAATVERRIILIGE
jgi:hypothetical protein